MVDTHLCSAYCERERSYVHNALLGCHLQTQFTFDLIKRLWCLSDIRDDIPSLSVRLSETHELLSLSRVIQAAMRSFNNFRFPFCKLFKMLCNLNKMTQDLWENWLIVAANKKVYSKYSKGIHTMILRALKMRQNNLTIRSIQGPRCVRAFVCITQSSSADGLGLLSTDISNVQISHFRDLSSLLVWAAAQDYFHYQLIWCFFFF